MKNTLPTLTCIPRLLVFAGLLMLSACDSEKSEDQAATPYSKDTSANIAEPQPQTGTDKGSPASHLPETDTATINLIKQVLRTQLLKDDLAALSNDQRSFMFSKIDLNNDHDPEIFVGFTNSYFCGSGGCTAFLLNSKGNLITRFTVSEFPMVVRPHTTQGWRDLLIGTASAKPSLHLVKWNGKKYPGNPSREPIFSEIPSEHSLRVLNCRDHADHWFQF